MADALQRAPSGADEGRPLFSATISDLPNDVLSTIVYKANPSVTDLCSWATLNRKMKAVCYSPRFWQKVEYACDPKRNVYGWGLEMLAGRCNQLEELVLVGLNVPDRPNPWIHYGLEQLLQACGKTTLRTLRLQFVVQLLFTDLLFTKVGDLCPLLEDFELSATNYFTTDAAVGTFIRACPNILHFRCFVKEGRPLHALGDSTLWTITRKWPGLRTLEINGHYITENGLVALQECRQLESLGLHGYRRGVFERTKSQPDEEDTEFGCLREILFAHTLPYAAEIRRLLHMCPQLVRLELLPADNDERKKQHAETLVEQMRTEYPHLLVVTRTMVKDGVEAVTATMLINTVLERRRRMRERAKREKLQAAAKSTDAKVEGEVKGNGEAPEAAAQTTEGMNQADAKITEGKTTEKVKGNEEVEVSAQSMEGNGIGEVELFGEGLVGEQSTDGNAQGQVKGNGEVEGQVAAGGEGQGSREQSASSAQPVEDVEFSF
eukprot:TRINITY_DN23943_c0_g1_i1.p1 TRINITY_DN23943_c0_g1~~TRINITY_DN23943_c0_g1_i1.p1  ORF type:complete len:492 (-),score=111.18 TRINITY_DN23943_c0_g1_i1:876-2351(-)